ncbi:TPA: glutathione S-transferase [Legionella pneumophila]|nr:glutathione S-transferase [Legionella pneumophila]HAU0842626.1 glutathione S-transferase [Legionella pneumophila]
MYYLYSFRRCPYAIRARMALKYAGIGVGIREVKLSNKPIELIMASEKATVPVLVTDSGKVIDESLDIMLWALEQSDPDNWLKPDSQQQIFNLIQQNDFEFKPILDSYKYPQTSEVGDPLFYRKQALIFLDELNTKLLNSQYLLSDKPCLADIAIFPFIRQFCMVDKDWFMQSKFKRLIFWLEFFLESPIFITVMKKYSPWKVGDKEPLLT